MRASLFLLLLLGVTEPARASQTVSLDDCFRAALARADSVDIEDERLHQAEGHYDQARIARRPTVSGAASYTFQRRVPDGPSPYEREALLTVQQPLFRGFRDFATLRQQSGLIEAAKLDRRAAVVQLYRDVVESYYGVLTLEKDGEDVDAELKMYDGRIQELKRFERIGRSRPGDRLSAMAARASLKAEASQLRGQILAEREVLAALTGLDLAVELKAPNEGDDAPPAANAAEAAQSRPEVLAAEARSTAAAEAMTAARNGHYPEVDVKGDYYLVRPDAQKDVRWDVQLLLTVPIYSGGLIESQVAEAASVQRENRDAAAQARRSAEREIRVAHGAVTSAGEQISDLRAATKLAKETYDAQLRDYGLGLVTNLDVLVASQQYQESQRALDHAQSDLALARARFAIATGRVPPR